MSSETQAVMDSTAQILGMIWQAKRFETFKSWPFEEDKPCSALKLAEAGFYFTGSSEEPDAVQCFLCDKALDGWDEGDDPWTEHFNHSKSCTFAKLGQPEEALTFQQLSDFHIELIKKHVEKSIQYLLSNADKNFNSQLAKLKKILNGLKKN